MKPPPPSKILYENTAYTDNEKTYSGAAKFSIRVMGCDKSQVINIALRYPYGFSPHDFSHQSFAFDPNNNNNSIKSKVDIAILLVESQIRKVTLMTNPKVTKKLVEESNKNLKIEDYAFDFPPNHRIQMYTYTKNSNSQKHLNFLNDLILNEEYGVIGRYLKFPIFHKFSRQCLDNLTKLIGKTDKEIESLVEQFIRSISSHIMNQTPSEILKMISSHIGFFACDKKILNTIKNEITTKESDSLTPTSNI